MSRRHRKKLKTRPAGSRGRPKLKRVEARPKSIIAAVDRIIEAVPIEGRRVKMDLVKIFLENRE